MFSSCKFPWCFWVFSAYLTGFLGGYFPTLSFRSLVFLFPWCCPSCKFPWCFWVRTVRKILDVFEVSLGVLGFPRPQTGARNPISWKRGFRGPKTPISPRSGKGSFLSKKSPFFCKGTHGKWGFLDRKLPFPAVLRATGKPSFPGNRVSGPCLGSGESQLVFSKRSRIVRGKRSHRARNPEKFKVTKK